MTDFTNFGPNCTLGEGPLWHPEREQLFWFDISVGRLFCASQDGVELNRWEFGEPSSAAGWIDKDQMIVATASHLLRFNVETGDGSVLCDLEADNPETRSNDGRIGPDGSFWIGTMARNEVGRVGAFYRYKDGTVSTLFDNVAIPNATCFSPDGRTAYLADTLNNYIWKWALDEAGNPVGEKEIHIDMRDEKLFPDGAVCDSEGYLWNAQYGASRVARYAPDGSFVSAIELPATQLTCPAFGGKDLKTLYVTSASQNLDEARLAKQPLAGQTFAIPVDVPGIKEFRAKI